MVVLSNFWIGGSKDIRSQVGVEKFRNQSVLDGMARERLGENSCTSTQSISYIRQCRLVVYSSGMINVSDLATAWKLLGYA